MAAALAAATAGDEQSAGISSAIPAVVAAVIAEDEIEFGKSSAVIAALAAAAAKEILTSGAEYATAAADESITEYAGAVVAEDEAKRVAIQVIVFNA